MNAFENINEVRRNGRLERLYRFSKSVEEVDESKFEQIFMQSVAQHRNQEAKQVKIGQFERESLATLARKFELSAELLALESDYPNVQGILRLYVNELKSAIESKLKAA
nr:MAG TPA: hypothetical protein [Caudoviricetes sp.]